MSEDVRIHPMSDVQSENIGAGTSIWQFCVILPQAQIGSDCNVCSHCLIENDVIVGDRVTVKCGVQLWDGLRVEDDVFIGPNVTFTNDAQPCPKGYRKNGEWDCLETHIQKGVTIGANATILPGLIIHEGAMIGAGAVVTCDVAPNTTVVGNPAREMKK